MVDGFYLLSSGDPKANLRWGKRKSLSYVYLELTNKCNMLCEYCQVGSEQHIDLDYSMVTDIIDQLHDLEIFELRLGGGEPLLYKRLEDVIAYAHSRNVFVWLCTNGYFLDLQTAYRLKKSGLSGVRISIDSTNAVTHDTVRKTDGAWRRCIAAINNAKLFQLGVVISMTIGSHNADEYDAMVGLANSLDCDLSTHFVMPVGKGVTFPKAEKTVTKSILTKLTGEKHCVAATDTVYIDVYGRVSACSFLKPIDSLKEKTIKQILDSPKMLKYSKPIGSEKCSCCRYGELPFCPLSNICRGGCWVNYDE